jgi:competence protein ComEC
MGVNFPAGAEPKEFVGRIESVDRHSGKERSRFTFVIDAVDQTFDPIQSTMPVAKWKDQQFAIIRVMTTYNKFAELAGIVDGNPYNLVGQWISLFLLPKGKASGPLAQVCPLTETGYGVGQKYAVGEISAFGLDPEAPRSLSAAGDRRKQVAATLANEGREFTGNTSVQRLQELENLLGEKNPVEVRVHDVGHANFTTISAAGRDPLFHFEVGWPVGFNLHTVSGPPPVIRAAPIVVLSHWDWDHLHGYYVWKMLKEKVWVAPIQDLGPGALKIGKALRDAGRLVSVARGASKGAIVTNGGFVIIGNCDPSHALTRSKVRNNSGLFVALKLKSEHLALLPGDADYRGIAWPHSSAPSLLVVSHHGAAVDGPIQAPKHRGALAVNSMGKDNVYRHPCTKTLRAHRIAGWEVQFTSASGLVERGDRTLR